MAPVSLPVALETLIGSYCWTPDTVGEAGAAVVRLDAPGRPSLYLKYGAGRIAMDIVDEYARLRWLQGKLPVPRIVHFLEAEGGAWLLTEAMGGMSAYAWLEAHPGRQRAAVEGMARFLRRLHALPLATCPFNASLPLRLAAARANIDAGLVDEDDFDPERAGWTAEQVWARLHTLLPLTPDPVVTHGDFSLDNILLEADGAVSGVIDVGRLGVADRYQDLAILLNCLNEFGKPLGDQLFAAYRTEPDPVRIEAHLLLDELF